MKIALIKIFLFLLTVYPLYAHTWNNPHNKDAVSKETLFAAFSQAPKHLDPVRSYNANEWMILGPVYEPPLQYNYLKRPYVLEPLTLTRMPEITYLDVNGTVVDENSTGIAFSRYTLTLRDDIKFQNHPAFVKEKNGSLKYGDLSEEALSHIETLHDFEEKSTRHLEASDYAYAIKRMAVRAYHSPILDNMASYIVGLKRYSEMISKIADDTKKKGKRLDLRGYDIEGVKVIDTQRLSITIQGKYPQFLYWLSMYFFAPIPWEADLFYLQKGLIEKNLTLNWFPVGTGAYVLTKNNPSRQMVLKANENFHTEYYPTLREKEKKESNIEEALLEDAGKKLPFIKEVVFSLEKESIPLWNKFLQGYYDASGISSESFDQAVKISASGVMDLSGEMAAKGIVLKGSVQPSIFYMAFNMEDPVVGGYSEASKKLRQAISIAQNQEEYISIFMNERGVAAQGPIPPGIVGYEEGEKGTDKVVYEWKEGKRLRKPLSEAKKLLAEAGYPNGISVKTGKQLKLHYDAMATGPDERALMDWQRKQFAKLGIQLVIRSTDYNRFQDKVRKGKVQIFSWGWNADYPDPENFLFLLYGGNAVVNTNGAGINSSNYQNAAFDRLFDEIKTMKNSPARSEKIEQMLEIVREDVPWVWGVHPKSLALSHAWFKNVQPNAMANNTLKYKRIDAKLRVEKQKEWNQPVLLPLVFLFLFILMGAYALHKIYVNRQKAVIKKVK